MGDSAEASDSTDPADARAALLEQIVRCRPGPSGSELSALARAITAALGLHGCAIVPAGAPPGPGPAGESDLRRSIPLLAGPDQVGELVLEPRPGSRMNTTRRRLLADVVDALGPVLATAALQRELHERTALARDHAERIGAARRVAFAERDAERHQLERDLHDGAQHHLVALRMAVGLLEVQLAESGTPARQLARDTATALGERISQAETVLLDTAAGVCPPVLVDHGLLEALGAELRDEQDRVKITAPDSVAGRRYPLNVEIAIYFTCLEAVSNALKHAPDASVTITLDDDGRRLRFAVSDTGPGLETADLAGSFGLGNMRERVLALGGHLDVTTAPGAGLTVAGAVPF